MQNRVEKNIKTHINLAQSQTNIATFDNITQSINNLIPIIQSSNIDLIYLHTFNDDRKMKFIINIFSTNGNTNEMIKIPFSHSDVIHTMDILFNFQINSTHNSIRFDSNNVIWCCFVSVSLNRSNI